MRYPPGHKEEVRARLVKAASHALRRDGLDGISIPALMKKAGLTHGGFYAHFTDKDEVVAAAVRDAADETAGRVFRAGEPGDGAAPLARVLGAYCSAEHAGRPGEGCVVAALGAEGRRSTGPVKKAFAYAARGLLQLVERSLQTSSGAAGATAAPAGARVSDDALDVTARMVGAVVLARIVDDDVLRDRLLAVGRRVPAAPAGARASTTAP